MNARKITEQIVKLHLIVDDFEQSFAMLTAAAHLAATSVRSFGELLEEATEAAKRDEKWPFEKLERRGGLRRFGVKE